MAPKPTFRPGPRKSNTSTPGPFDDAPTIADKLSYADLPRPFKSPYPLTTKLTTRTASSSTTSVRKNAKQILTLERERYSGGDGFLSAIQTAAKARGEPIELGGKKKKGGGGLLGVGVGGGVAGNGRRGFNLKGRKGLGGGGGGGSASVSVSGAGTPQRSEIDEEEEGEEEDDLGLEGLGVGVGVPLNPDGSRKEIITYHTPAAPPSLLPPKKYCDITGLHAGYTDPRTKLRYKGLDVWHVVRGLGPGGDQAYLALRGAQTSLK